MATWTLVDESGQSHEVDEVQQFNLRFLMLAEASNWRPVILDGTWEAEQRAEWQRMIDQHQSEIGIDVGANNGIYTLMMADSESIKEVVSIEPTDPHFSMAKWATRRLATPVRVEMVACSDTAEQKEMIVFPTSTPSINQLVESKIYTDAEVANYKGQRNTVVTAPLDSLVEASEKRVAIKIDTEGHELKVLAGAERLLADNDCILQVECFDSGLPDFLRPYGYELVNKIKSDWYFVRTRAV